MKRKKRKCILTTCYHLLPGDVSDITSDPVEQPQVPPTPLSDAIFQQTNKQQTKAKQTTSNKREQTNTQTENNQQTTNTN